MSSIDERVVHMKFNNEEFQQGVRTTLQSLSELNKSLALQGSNRAIGDLDQMARSLDNIDQHTSKVAHGFSIMRIAAYTAISTITRQALYAGEQLVKSFTIDPIKLGFSNYEEQINAVQTIMANTGLKGSKGMAQVNGVLKDLNNYANLTVYNFSEMAKNIGTFTAAGVKLKPAADAIKGIANLAAFSGATSMQASSAMYQLSQALAANQVKLQDWNSVVNAGIGGKAFQNALFMTGEAMHRLKGVKMGETFDQWTKSGHTFRQSLKDGWINAEVLTRSLKAFTGDESNAQLKALGYSKQQIAQIREWGKTAQEAATKIKTITQLKQALREEVGTAYASIFKTLFGDINQAKSWLSPLHTFLENMLTNPIYAINRVLQGWAKLGGRVVFIDAMKEGFQEIRRIIEPIKDAFKEIFPSTTAQTLYKLTTSLHVFIENLNISDKTVNNLRRTFAGVFAILDIGWQILKNVAHFLGDMLGQFRDSSSSGGILSTTAKLGDFLVRVDKIVKSGQGLRNFFVDLEHVLHPPLALLGTLVGYLETLAGHATGGLSKVSSSLQNIGKALAPVGEAIRNFFTHLFSNINFDNVLKVLNVGLLGGMVLLVKRIMDKFDHKGGPSPIQGFINKITEPFEQLTTTLKEMQKTLRATTILEIATSVALLAGSVVALSKIDVAGLSRALGAMTVMFGQLFGALALFNKVGGAKGLVTTSAGLILFATALHELTRSVKALSDLSWTQLAKGLTGVTVLIGALVVAARGMSGNAQGMIRTGAGLTIMAVGIRILADAVKELGGISWANMAKGLVGVGTVLAGLALFTRFAEAGKAGVLQGAGLLLLATAINVLAGAVDKFGKMQWENIGKGLASIGAILAEFAIFSKTVGNPVTLLASSVALVAISSAMLVLAKAVKSFGGMNWENIGKGLLTMGGALAVIVLALRAMPLTSVLSAAALVGVSIALVAIGKAVEGMGGMSWSEIAKGLVTLAGSLTIIALAMAGMTGALPGAAALLVVAAALVPLTAVLEAMGHMSWGDIAKGLVALAGALTVIGVAGVLLDAGVPGLLALGGAIALIGVGVAAIGGGLFLFSIGLTAIATSGAAAAAGIRAIFDSIIGLLPDLAKVLGKTLVALAEAIAKALPSIIKAAIVLLDGMLTAIDREGPKVIKTFFHLVSTLLDQLSQHAGKFTSEMINIITSMLNALARNMGKFTTAGTNLVVSFINGVSKNIGRIITAGTNLIIKFVEGIGKSALQITNAAAKTLLTFLQGFDASVRQYEPQLISEGEQIAFDILAGVAKGIAMAPIRLGTKLGGDVLKGFNWAIGRKSPAKEFIKAGQDITAGLKIGLAGGHDQIVSTWTNLRDDLKTAISKSADDIKRFSDRLSTLESAHKKNAKAIREMAANLREATREHTISINVLNELDKRHQKQYQTLQTLGKQYDTLKQKIADADQALKDAIKTRDDYAKQIKDQYSTLPTAGNDVTVALQATASQIQQTTVDQTKTTTALQDYTNKLQFQVNDTVKYAQVLQQLRDMGLNDAMYQKLLSDGPASLQFAEELLQGGASAVNNIDSLSDQLVTAAGNLGQKASVNLYQAGVDAAQGLVNGLTSQEKHLEAEMEKIAASLIKALKKKLKIKSPSQEFDALGQFSTLGLAVGLVKAIPHVEKATAAVGQKAMDAMKKAISGVSDLVTSNINTNPTIAPVVDLSNVHKGLSQLDTAFSNKQINVGATYSSATVASAGYQANKTAAQAAVDALAAPPAQPGDITFIQNNNSPKALSSAEIYRQTKNQLSQVKGVLTPNAA